MTGKLMKLLKSMRNEDGATVLEFAIVSTIFVTFLMGIIEFSIVLFTGALLESAVLESSRFGSTGTVEEGKTQEEMILDMITEKTLGFIDVNLVTIETKVYPAFDDVGDPEPFTDSNDNGVWDEGEDFDDVNGSGTWEDDMGSDGLGNANDIVLYKLSYSAGPMTAMMAPLIGDITHTATVAVKNEPF